MSENLKKQFLMASILPKSQQKIVINSVSKMGENNYKNQGLFDMMRCLYFL